MIPDGAKGGGMDRKAVYGLVGPTASGKTALSLRLVQAVRGEILCMDSMQIYRGMDIGTAKPTAEERAVAPHHLLDIADPAQPFSVTEYTALARPLLDSVAAPILVGGTGFYLRGLSQPMDFGYVRGSQEIRDRYERMAAQEGVQAVHDRLRAADPASADRLHPNDLRRVIRALEVFELTGERFSEQKPPDPADAPWRFILFALDWPRETLYRRIDARVDVMLAQGLTDEVRRLLERGVPADAQAMQGIGYKELIPVLNGEMPLAEAADLIRLRSRHYAKRQLTWFRADPRIRWIAMTAGRTLDSAFDELMERRSNMEKQNDTKQP